MIDTFNLAAARQAHPLPEGVEDTDDMSLDQLAAALGTSTNTVSKFVKQGMPVVEQGGHGQAYKVRLSDCYAWREWLKAEEARRLDQSNRAVAQMQASLMNLPEVEEGLTPSSLREMANASLAWNQARQKQGALCDTDDVRALLGELVETLREGLASVPDTLERELGLTPDQVQVAVRACDDIIDDVRGRIAASMLAGREIGAAPIEPQPLVI